MKTKPIDQEKARTVSLGYFMAIAREGSLVGIDLFASRQALGRSHTQNIFTSWFGDKLDMMNVIGTFDLITNASAFVREGMGYLLPPKD